jgi:23S rRNA pseudouridine2605 synthase
MDPVEVKNSERILMLHKPKGFEVTRPRTPGEERLPGHKTVYSLLPAEFHAQGWVPVGRLDKDSTGLLLFVREGFLVRRLQTPRNIDKIYEVWVKGHLKPEHMENILKGVRTPIGILKAKAVWTQGVVGPNSLVKVVLDEGKNRHIRRMFAGLKDAGLNRFFKALDLTRTSIGPVQLDIEPGQWRFLTEKESEAVLKSVAGSRSPGQQY